MTTRRKGEHRHGWGRRWLDGQARAEGRNVAEMDRRLESPGAEARLNRLQKKFRALGPVGRRPPQRRRRPPFAGLILFGLALGAAIGLLAADPIAGYQLKRAAATLRGQPPPLIEQPDFTGHPSRIVDGDTFDFGSTRIRLHGVDTPEMSTPEGEQARAALAALVATGGGLHCADTGKRTYGRTVALCTTADGRDLSAALAEQGWGEPMLGLGGWAYVPAWVRGMWGRR